MLRAWPPEAIPAHFMLSERPGCPCPDLLPCLRASSQPGLTWTRCFAIFRNLLSPPWTGQFGQTPTPIRIWPGLEVSHYILKTKDGVSVDLQTRADSEPGTDG